MQDRFILNIKHPLLENHCVHGQHLLPGLAYIDMIYQFFRDNGFDFNLLELKNVTIYEPLIVQENCDVLVELLTEQVSESIYSVRISTRECRQSVLSETESLCVNAEMHQHRRPPEIEQMDPDLFNRQKEGESIGKIYDQCKKHGMVHTGIMKAKGKIISLPDTTYIDISVGAENGFADEDIMFHPALIDGSAIGSAGLFQEYLSGEVSKTGEGAMFLPIYYESFRASKLFRHHVIARIEKATVKHRNELLTLSIIFFNSEGSKIGELTNFSNKLIRTPNTIKNPQIDSMPTDKGLLQQSIDKDMQGFLLHLFSKHLKREPEQIKTNVGYYEMGLDSQRLLSIGDAINKYVGKNLPPTLLFEYSTIEQLGAYLASASYPSDPAPTGSSEVYQEDYPAELNQRNLKPSKRSSRDYEEIAIIGVAGKYPNAENLDVFWKNLCDGKDCIREIPENRWNTEKYTLNDILPMEKTSCRWGAFLENVDQFDAAFFKMTPSEAEIMDPMVRLFIEVTWNLLEQSGYTKDIIARKHNANAGVFVGAMYQHYQMMHSDLIKESLISLHSYSTIANHVSYFFGFEGPSMAIDTMCSSSLVAVHTACESLQSRNCQIAIAGGVNLSLHPKKYIALEMIQMLSSDPSRRAFGESDGFIPGEGVGAVLLKLLSDAEKDKDTILAVIKASATNHNGHANGYSVPNPNAQIKLMVDNFSKSGVDPRTVSYVEAAANGSALGDLIEVSALDKTFRKYTSDKHFCALGSVKNNIGHGEAASGIAQLSKVVLQLKHKQLVPTIRTDPPNPKLDLNDSPFYLQKELKKWQRPVLTHESATKEILLRATVSSFGAGGSNAHLILEEYLKTPESNLSRRDSSCHQHNASQLMIFSAMNRWSLSKIIEQMVAFVEEQADVSLADLAYTLQCHRESMPYRVAVIAKSTPELLKACNAFLKGEDCDDEVKLYYGNIEEPSEIRKLLTETAEKAAIEAFCKENNLDKIGYCWTQGSIVPWHQLKRRSSCKQISLPTYAFHRRSYWTGTIAPGEGDGDKTNAGPDTFEHSAIMEHAEYTEEKITKDVIVSLMAEILGIEESDVKLDRMLTDYGFDSILSMQLFMQLKMKINPALEIEKLKDCKSIQDILDILPSTLSQKKGIKKTQCTSKIQETNFLKFPELVPLNQKKKGVPVFWFHGGQGGVESYLSIAEASERPFYGIQARGWMTNRSPLHGIQAMVAYSIQIIQSVQPEGPYDLGGYSLGGTIAYEVTRQVQELGEHVNTIVMIDSMDSGSGDVKHPTTVASNSRKTAILNVVNMALLSKILHKPEKINKTLVHPDELSLELNDEAFLKQIVALARTRGLKNSEEQLRAMINQHIKVQQAFEADRHFEVLPLQGPKKPDTYFFRNKSGVFFGDLESYFNFNGSNSALRLIYHKQYWKQWEQHLPDIHIIDLDASNHLMMLSEEKVRSSILSFCKQLYSEQGLSRRILVDFIKTAKQIHGVMETTGNSGARK